MQFGARSFAITRRAFITRSAQKRHIFRGRNSTGRVANPDTASTSTVTTQHGTSALLGGTWTRATITAAGLITGATIWRSMRNPHDSHTEAQSLSSSSSEWHEAFASDNNLVKVGSAREVLSNSPITKNFIEQDNLFDKMMEVEMVKELHCYYDETNKEFHSIIHLGKEVCGYPNTVHGGLTAAIIDETFGGLMFNIWRSGELGWSLPAVTARLEVDYCNRLPQNSVVLCTTKLDGKREGRSFWMQAELRDQSKDIVYATARACFVSPSWHRSAIKWVKGIAGI